MSPVGPGTKNYCAWEGQQQFSSQSKGLTARGTDWRQTANSKVTLTLTQAVSRWLSTAAARVRNWVQSCGICGDKVALGQVFSEYYGFPCQSSFHQ
jgi:hypothetical protein